MGRDLLDASLEALAERAGDPTAAVYARLFEVHPELEPLFVGDTTGAARGEMLAKVFELALDLAGDRTYAVNFIRAERVNHDGLGVPREVFPRFFAIAVAVIEDLAGDAWTAEMRAAWQGFLADVEEISATP